VYRTLARTHTTRPPPNNQNKTGLGPGKGYVDVSTVDAATSREVAALASAAGAAFLEAPVSGSKGPAEQGQLIFLCAGDRPLFDAAAAPLDVMGKRAFYLGDVGAGAHMKLVVNMVMVRCGCMHACMCMCMCVRACVSMGRGDSVGSGQE
jgi:3-hydroxyisobutyrate dehydrogenase-like beta-hydroxyacid dehydrogenase